MHYAQTNYLIEKKFIRCDELLRGVFDVELLPVASLRQKLQDEHLSPAKPFIVEYALTTTGTIALENLSGLTKIGGKQFDIEVDVLSESASEAQLILNETAQVFEDSDERLAGLHVLGQYFSRRCYRLLDELAALNDVENDPLGKGLNPTGSLPAQTASKQLETMSALDDVGAIVTGRSCYHFLRNNDHPPTSGDEDDDDDGDDEYEDTDADDNDDEKNGEEGNLSGGKDCKMLSSVGGFDAVAVVMNSDRTQKFDVQHELLDKNSNSKRAQAPLIAGAIHSLKGFIDVGNQHFFKYESDEWFQESAKNVCNKRSKRHQVEK